MNKGRICISVCAETADELIEQIKRAEDLADVIEIRFDCLSNGEFDKFFRQFSKKNFTNKFLTTFRAQEQGGKTQLTYQQRLEFWFHSHIFESTDWADLEEDISIEKLRNLWGNNIFENFIKSSHYFEEIPTSFLDVYERLKLSKSEIIKIAAQADDVADTIPIWKLLEKAKSDGKEIIPIAMGEAGKWTRILGLAHGAFLTYAALDSGKETAPGQISARDLAEVYRAKELDENTEVYGIIAGNTSYTLSPYMHNAAFKFHQLNAVFIPLQVNDLDEFMRRMVLPETREIELNFRGFSVTNPHKQAIIKYLDDLDETARRIGAVNTVKIENGKLCGYNTDAQGFIEPLKSAYGDLSKAKVAVFGAGGAARACIYALKQENAEVTLFARNPEKAESLAKEFKVRSSKFKVQSESYDDFDILVNTTPLGTKGEFENETPAVTEQLKNIQLAYDLVYNPFETRFLREAKSADVPTIGGLAMLIAQGAGQQKIWTNLDAPTQEMSRAALQKLQK